MTKADARPQIRSEARGPHWIAWLPDENGKPRESVIVVGETKEEAEERARVWGETYAPR